MKCAGLLAKSGGDGRCRICGLICDFRNPKRCHRRLKPTYDHIIPRSKGGGESDRNLQLAHAYCNSKRGGCDITDEFRAACRFWILKYVGEHEIAAAQRFFDQTCVRKVDRSSRLEMGWWEKQDLGPHDDVFFRSAQGGLCNGK